MIREKIKLRVSGSNSDVSLVYLFLPSKKYKRLRKIGELNTAKKTFYSVPRNSKKHLMRSNNSLGICYKLILDHSKSIKYICIPYDENRLWVTKKRLKKFGTFLHFQRNDLEKQIFLGIDKFAKSKRKAKGLE